MHAEYGSRKRAPCAAPPQPPPAQPPPADLVASRPRPTIFCCRCGASQLIFITREGLCIDAQVGVSASAEAGRRPPKPFNQRPAARCGAAGRPPGAAAAPAPRHCRCRCWQPLQPRLHHTCLPGCRQTPCRHLPPPPPPGLPARGNGGGGSGSSRVPAELVPAAGSSWRKARHDPPASLPIWLAERCRYISHSPTHL